MRKTEYLVTLPLRIIGAILAAPFAIHSRPLGAALGFVALFGFWEVWNDFAKEPVLRLYNLRSLEFQTQALRENPDSNGDPLNSNYKAAKWLVELPFRMGWDYVFGEKHRSAELREAADTKGSQSDKPSSGSLTRIDKAVADVSQALNQRITEGRQRSSPLPHPEDINKGVKKDLDRALGMSDDPDLNPALEGMPGYPAKSRATGDGKGSASQQSSDSGLTKPKSPQR